MSHREKILRYYQSGDDAPLAGRLLDLAEGAVKNKKYKVSEFLDPHAFNIAETIAAHYSALALISSGGYNGAERVKAAFADQDFLEMVSADAIDFSLGAVSVKWDARYEKLSHRDVLGALMGQGIKREVAGDIIMTPDGCQIVLERAMRDFVLANLQEIGRAKVDVESISLDGIVPREEKVKEIRATVASLRLDAVAAAGFGTSRSKMAEDIASAKLKVNWQDTANAAHSVKPGDIISMRGRGRVEVCDVPGKTKKGRYSILLKRFI